MKRTLLLLSIVTLVSACGQKSETVVQQPGPAAAAPHQHQHSAPAVPVAERPVQPVEQPAAEALLPKVAASGSAAATSGTSSPAGSEAEKVRITRLAATVLRPDGMDPAAAMVYGLAKDIPDRLEKLYCYCHCHEDPLLHHKSLLSCYQDHHAVECAVCQNEARQAWLDWKDGVPVEVSVKEINLMYNGGNPAPSTPIPE